MKRYVILLLISVFFSFEIKSVSGQGLSIHPTKVEIKGGQKASEIWVLNTSNETKTFSASFNDYRMTQSGGVQKLPEGEEAENSAAQYVRIHPDVITLGPGESQTVKLQARLPRDLDDLELRSRMRFEEMESNYDRDLGADPEELQEEGTVAIGVQSKVSLSVPVFVRAGELNVSASIEGVDVVKGGEEENNPYINVKIHRDGNRTSRGDFVVKHVSPGGDETQIAKSNFPIYYPLEEMSRRVNVSSLDPEELNEGHLEVSYEYEEDGRSAVTQKTEKIVDLD